MLWHHCSLPHKKPIPPFGYCRQECLFQLCAVNCMCDPFFFFSYPATWAATCHLQRIYLLLCKEFIMAEDSPHVTMHYLTTWWCSLGDLSDVSAFGHSPSTCSYTLDVFDVSTDEDEEEEEEGQGDGDTARRYVGWSFSLFVMCVCVCVCVYICVCTSVCVHLCVSVYICVCIYVCLSVFIGVEFRPVEQCN